MQDVTAVAARVAELQHALTQLNERPAADFAAVLARQGSAGSATAVAPSAGVPGAVPPSGALGPTATLGQMLAAPASGSVMAPAPVTLTSPAASVSAPAALSGTGFMSPVDGEITSEFGPRTHPITGEHKMHEGLDFAAPHGTPIRAADAGTVTYAGVMGGYGNVVMVKHANGLQTLYAHTSSMDVSVGDKVGRGEVIARVGSTGMSTGPHLHFEVQRDGEAVDPERHLHRHRH